MPSLFCQGSLKDPVCPLTVGDTVAPCESLNCHRRVSMAGVKRRKRCCMQPALAGPSWTMRRVLLVHRSGLPDFHISVFQKPILNLPYCKIKHFCVGKHRINSFSFSAPFTCSVSLIYPHLGTYCHQSKVCLLWLCQYPWDLQHFWFGWPLIFSHILSSANILVCIKHSFGFSSFEGLCTIKSLASSLIHRWFLGCTGYCVSHCTCYIPNQGLPPSVRDPFCCR